MTTLCKHNKEFCYECMQADAEEKGMNRHLVQVKSSSSNKLYDVNLKELSCTCPDYLFRKKHTGELCKHIKEAIENKEK